MEDNIYFSKNLNSIMDQITNKDLYGLTAINELHLTEFYKIITHYLCTLQTFTKISHVLCYVPFVSTSLNYSHVLQNWFPNIVPG